MVYSLDRDTPCPTLEKVSREELQRIAARVEALGHFLLRRLSSRPIPNRKIRTAMQILLSCAKTMADHTAIRTPRTTEPRFQREADAAAAALASLPADDLARILRVNRTIAAENRRRYASFHDAESQAALAAYTGIVFKRLDPGSFTDDDFEYAQEHLNITSFLYGCSARWTPSDPTGSKATPSCRARRSRHVSTSGGNASPTVSSAKSRPTTACC